LPVFSVGRSRFKRDLPSGKKVIFLSDVFSHYLEAHVEESACAVLNALGYEVVVLPTIGAGASLLSKGFIEAAQRHAEKVLVEIKARDPESALSVVGCEPPEVYCLKHEYAALLPSRRTEIESIAKRTWLLDEFLLRVSSEENGLLKNQKIHKPTKIFFHPHCHQQAETSAKDGISTGSAATMDLLRAAGFEVELSVAGCCGMAGTFGFDAEHFDLSMQIGEMKLFPQARRAQDALMVSTGASCRMHLRQALARDVVHPVELVRGMLI
ncbi:MAG: heterodisulfide reductase-related iron-sulfur binding cluster, partial [Anaerolineales bacterium]|nr:heterodisulfide reductase-related iron-sulfur binding cluster [Anaerolineales bacterium]